MNLMSKIFGNTRKPEGFFGKLMVDGMNGGSHEKLAKWGLSHIRFRGDENVLDCGCGGGANLARMLSLLPEGTVCGMDYSEVSVRKSQEVNKAAITEGKCSVIQGNVAAIPFKETCFDVATAFETVYFWPDPAENFKEVCRVLKPGGIFIIVNESNGRNEKSLKWTKIIEGMTVYTGDQLRDLLKVAGFTDIRIDDDHVHDRLTVTARRPS